MTLLVQERDAEAISYLAKSIAITPATGRSHAVLATAYHRLGRTAEAKTALAKTMELRPGSTVANIRLDPRNASPLYNEASKRVEPCWWNLACRKNSGLRRLRDAFAAGD